VLKLHNLRTFNV